MRDRKDPSRIAPFADLNDDGLLWRKFSKKRSLAIWKGIGFTFQFEEFCDLLRAPGIKSSDYKHTSYQLARYGDVGPYAPGNCRFVPWQVNQAEKKPTASHLISAGLKRRYETHSGSFLGRKHKPETKAAIGAANAISAIGERNSQFGRRWVNNGTVDKKVDASEVHTHLSSGWNAGRVKVNLSRSQPVSADARPQSDRIGPR